MENQTADIEWKDSGVPVSSKFDDPYFSLDNGVEETQHVFIDGNDLTNRFRDGFRIGELGFGTGLNFLVAWDAAATSANCATFMDTLNQLRKQRGVGADAEIWWLERLLWHGKHVC